MTRPPLELLLEGWETRVRQLNEISRTERDEQTARYYAARAAELSDCIKALRAQAEAEAGAGEAWALDSLDSDGHAEATWWFTSQAAALASIPAIVRRGQGVVESVTPDADDPEEYVAAVRLPDPPTEMVERFRAQGHPHDGRGGLLRYRFRVSVAPFPELHTAALAQADAGGEAE